MIITECLQYTSERCVDHKLGFEGCILAYSDPSHDEGVHGFPRRQGNLIIQSDALWVKHSAKI